jgi:beta-lactamase regulating signal transducer with metallopeptidase domain
MMAQMARHLMESTAFALIVALLPRLMRTRGAAARHTVWLTAAAKFAVPAALFSAAGAYLRGLFPVHPLGFVISPVIAHIVTFPGAVASSTATRSEAWIPIALLWLGGAAAMLLVWLWRLRAPPLSLAPVPEEERETLARLGRQMGLRRAVALRYALANVEPGLSGVWRPTLTISQEVRSQLTAAELEAVLLHELAHAKRHDNLSSALVHILVCLFWFHPLLWWIERQLLRERELACDELVVRHSARREEYVKGILKVCQFHLRGAVAAACGITGSDLKTRLEAIMSFQPGNRAARAPKLLLGALAAWMTIVPLGGGLLSSLNLFGQERGGANPSSAPQPSKGVRCVARSISFPEGTLIYVTGMKGTHLCVAGPHGPRWDWSGDPKRESRPDIIVLPTEPSVPCEIRPSTLRDTCACQTGPFSHGAIVESAEGKVKLYCDHGNWRAATRHEQGLE